MNALASVVAGLVNGRLDFDDLVSERLTPSEVAALREIRSTFQVSPAQLAVRLREAVIPRDWAEATGSGVVAAEC